MLPKIKPGVLLLNFLQHELLLLSKLATGLGFLEELQHHAACFNIEEFFVVKLDNKRIVYEALVA